METFLSDATLTQLEQRKRVSLVNSVSGFKSLNLVGTVDSSGHTNLAIFNSVFHLGSSPALLGFIARPDSVERHTIANIESTGFYTLNHVHAGVYKEAHQTAARYLKNVSEFDATGLEAIYQNDFPAPFVKESRVRMGMAFRQRIDLTINGTILIVGEIVQLYFPGDCWCDDGYLDIEKAGTLSGSSLDGYHTTTRIDRLSYPKPGVELQAVPLTYGLPKGTQWKE